MQGRVVPALYPGGCSDKTTDRSCLPITPSRAALRVEATLLAIHGEEQEVEGDVPPQSTAAPGIVSGPLLGHEVDAGPPPPTGQSGDGRVGGDNPPTRTRLPTGRLDSSSWSKLSALAGGTSAGPQSPAGILGGAGAGQRRTAPTSMPGHGPRQAEPAAGAGVFGGAAKTPRRGDAGANGPPGQSSPASLGRPAPGGVSPAPQRAPATSRPRTQPVAGLSSPPPAPARAPVQRPVVQRAPSDAGVAEGSSIRPAQAPATRPEPSSVESGAWHAPHQPDPRHAVILPSQQKKQRMTVGDDLSDALVAASLDLPPAVRNQGTRQGCTPSPPSKTPERRRGNGGQGG